jgi:hypothetical protein
MASHTIKDVLANGRLPSGRTFREIVAPLHDATPPEEREEESAQFVADLIATVRQERREKRAGSGAE